MLSRLLNRRTDLDEIYNRDRLIDEEGHRLLFTTTTDIREGSRVQNLVIKRNKAKTAIFIPCMFKI